MTDFNFSEEQILLRDSVRKFVEREYSFEVRRRYDAEGGYNQKVWTLMAEQGWLGAGIPELLGGFGGGPIESAIVLHELGRGLVLEPYLAVCVLAAHALQTALAPAATTERLAALVRGESLVVLAHREAGQAGQPERVRTSAVATGHCYRISGVKLQILGGVHAQRLLVSARTNGVEAEPSGITLFEVPADTPGLTRKNYRLIDGTPVADLTFDNVLVDASARVGSEGTGIFAISSALDHGTVGLCAQAVGAMERALEITTEYLRTRRQFGVAIGSFQALQHQLADMLIELEQSRSMLYRALAHLDDSQGRRHLAVAAAKAQICKSARYIASKGVQLHGGIGITDECTIGHYFKSLYVAEKLFGNAAVHLQTLSRALIPTAPQEVV
ncbi:acyl-CoA dehydrogenase family protein [Sinimarinibacterium flocculans]|uniref:Alkylation response protein AidB-like acyl-CoA dehydrogenase n=1 Tax=Sinimarinibacterium flocculans TaxID=985250 RepID=A0A318EFT2_9GAMM|nr:acyl-CoA dehydrogenase family protein [Sinimarinibacterium flocculans]PXV71659.1 hypothetical protein C8D93_101714 [Sinimarinibacterium flocculans]